MIPRYCQQCRDMAVGKPIIRLLPSLPESNEVCFAERLEVMRDRRLREAGLKRNIADAQLRLLKRLNDLQPRWVGEDLEDLRRLQRQIVRSSFILMFVHMLYDNNSRIDNQGLITQFPKLLDLMSGWSLFS